jgi:hypothetical protein
MELLGSANWWIPRRLGKVLSRFDLDSDARSDPEPLDGGDFFVTPEPVVEPAADGRERVPAP